MIYIDQVRANEDVTIMKEKGGLVAISVDELTKTQRTLHTTDGVMQQDGSSLVKWNGQWVNVDHELGIVSLGDKGMAFGERANNNSILTAKLYASYSEHSREVKRDEIVDNRAVVYYSNINAEGTASLANLCQRIPTPDGWGGVMVFDPDSTGYLLISNFSSAQGCVVNDVTTARGCPVFTTNTTISDKGSSAIFVADANHSVANVLKFFIQGSNVVAFQQEDDSTCIYLTNLNKRKNTITINAFDAGKKMTRKLTLRKKKIKISISEGTIQMHHSL